MTSQCLYRKSLRWALRPNATTARRRTGRSQVETLETSVDTIHDPPPFGRHRVAHNRETRIVRAWDALGHFERECAAGAEPDDAQRTALARLRAEHAAEESEARDLIALMRQDVRAAA